MWEQFKSGENLRKYGTCAKQINNCMHISLFPPAHETVAPRYWLLHVVLVVRGQARNDVSFPVHLESLML